MSQLRTTILDDIKQAMRDKAKEKLTVLRNLSAAIKQKEVDERPEDGISDNDIIQIIDTMIKQRRESAAQYREGNRADLAEQEESEITIYQNYLPQQLSQDEINALIDEALANRVSKDMSEMEQVMAELKPKMLGRADMRAVSKIIKEKLTQ